MPITNDPERLSQVAAQLGAAVRDAGQGARVRLPVIQPADAAGLVMVMHAQLDDAIDERSAMAAAQGQHIACSAGCSSCCVAPVLVTEGEAVTVAEWLRLPANAEVRTRFAAAYPAWKKGLGTTIDALHHARDNDERLAAAIDLDVVAGVAHVLREHVDVATRAGELPRLHDAAQGRAARQGVCGARRHHEPGPRHRRRARRHLA